MNLRLFGLGVVCVWMKMKRRGSDDSIDGDASEVEGRTVDRVKKGELETATLVIAARRLPRTAAASDADEGRPAIPRRTLEAKARTSIFCTGHKCRVLGTDAR